MKPIGEIVKYYANRSPSENLFGSKQRYCKGRLVTGPDPFSGLDACLLAC